MTPNYFIQLSKDCDYGDGIEKSLTKYAKKNPGQLIFCINSPLGIESNYDSDGFMILSPGHKVTFIGTSDREDLDEYVSDVIDDISSLSKIHNYQEFIGRPRMWAKRIVKTAILERHEDFDFDKYVGENHNLVEDDDKRLLKYIISLLTGSINELNRDSLQPAINVLDEIKKKIMLFDADQTRFLYRNYQVRRSVGIQGLSGTGKTELLFHKLREIYDKDENVKIFFTCHNIALANEIRGRIPSFFNKMKVTRQIEWNQKLWVSHAWGSRSNPDSGLYSYICDRYNIPFYQYHHGVTYELIYSKVLDALTKIPKDEFSPCFDYIMIDENQDFPEVFFEVCKKITKRMIYTAGDVFQNIFYQNQANPKGFDISLTRCYRTDPRTLMFAHTLGLGLREEKRYNWFERKDWELFGYSYSNNKARNTVTLSREPILRFDCPEPEESVVISQGTNVADVCNILKSLIRQYKNIKPGDVSIIMIDDDKEIFGYMDRLSARIKTEVGWNVLRGHEDKHTDPMKLYLTNTNNVKGLEFPFVICITSKIEDNALYRNKIYTMLTRSFLVTYLLIKDSKKIPELKQIYSDISNNHSISDIRIPDEKEKQQIQHSLIKMAETKFESWDEFMSGIFKKCNINDVREIGRLKSVIIALGIDKFDETRILNCIESNRQFM